MDTRIAKDFHDACNKAFGFLITDKVFQPSTLEVHQRIDFAIVTFLGRNVAVECAFDERESWIDVNIVRIVNGALPTDYSTDSMGNRVREGLYSLLIRRGVRGFGPRTEGLSEKPTTEMFRTTLAKYADLLKKHGSDIIADSPHVFGDFWLCLSLDTCAAPAAGYTHIAFSIDAESFEGFRNALMRNGVETWKEDVSEGNSVYFLDPDGHRLEAHVGTLQSRLQALHAESYSGLCISTDI